ncbi:caspase family protein [Oxynema sp. CENA135]|uniref:caspase family protein n=1 Tax=Oxynema sp. CENA135 TaxID=984206 RepID=UPI00190CA292|nr:caspase family protein [Oxynema sp. CENA135]MBK4732701.1 caspase family protein [Oxynema sp. CENA135]
MTTHAGIFIGINEYKYLQPLGYAKQDAEELARFLLQNRGFAGERTLLVTDSSIELQSNLIYPTHANLGDAIEEFCDRQLQSDDVLWFFFSGYGVTWRGEDYLMPIDGNPDDIGATGISMRSLYNAFNGCPTDKILVVLDMNRAMGTSAGEEIGRSTAELAREMQIPTILSCQHEQFSRETGALQHGFFTAALLEALRSGDVENLESLDRLLRDRLPQLCERHCRPRQDPLTIANPPEKLQLVFLPRQLVMAGAMNAGDREIAAIPTVAPVMATHSDYDDVDLPPREELAPSAPTQTTSNTHSIELPYFDPERERRSRWADPNIDNTGYSPVGNTIQPPPAPLDSNDDEENRNNSIAGWLFWGGLVALIILLGLFWPELVKMVNSEGQEETPTEQVTGDGEPVRAIGTTTTGTAGNSGTPATPGTNATGENNGATAATGENNGATAATGENNGATAATGNNNGATAATGENNGATAATGNNNGTTAATPQTPAPTGNQDNTATGSPGETGGDLDRVLAPLEPAQAHQFGYAIAEAREIPQDDPRYDQAQKDIDRWGAVILDIAISRAQQGNYEGAVAAGNLVPKDRPQLQKEVQVRMPEWERQAQTAEKNREILQEAQSLVRRGQASSYNRAIALARQITPGQPQYEQARTLIERWSDTILQIAQYRASRRRFSTATQAAQLVPQDTAAYPAAKELLERLDR